MTPNWSSPRHAARRIVAANIGWQCETELQYWTRTKSHSKYENRDLVKRFQL